MSSKVVKQRNKLIHLENTLVMYGVYNAETLEKHIKLYIHYTVDNPCTGGSHLSQIFGSIEICLAYQY